MAQLFKNNVMAVTAADITDTTISIPVVSTATLPVLGAGDWFYLTLTDKREGGELRWEIVKVTSYLNNELTVVRGQDGTSAQEWALGSELSLRVTAGDMQELENFKDTHSHAALAPLASPALTGTPTAPTAALGTNTTQVATTAFVNAEIANDAPTKTGDGASGTWGIAITGNAGTATKLATARTINGVAFDGTANITIADSTKIPATEKGAANGVASLGSDGKVPAAQLPSYVDDVVEAATLPTTGETGKIYIKTGDNTVWRWTGSTYVEISVGTGTADSATKLATARTISLSGDVTGSATFDGSANATITATIAANSVALGTDTTGNYVAGITAGAGITVTGTAGEGWSPTVSVDAASVNTASKIVTRDAAGNFSAGTITATLTGNSTTATLAGKLDSYDTRSVVDTPQSFTKGLELDFKTNTTDGLSDGGTYHGVMTYRQYASGSDWSGGGVRQLGFTDNHNLWIRGANADNIWSAWNRLALTKDTNRVLARHVRTASSNARLMLRLPWNTNASHMLSFDINIYASYGAVTIKCSGYLFESINNWYEPEALVTISGGGVEPTVLFGRDTDGRAYVSFVAGMYSGVVVNNLVLGYTQASDAMFTQEGWSIAENVATPNSAGSNVQYGINTGNYNNYTPTKTGDGASGTWGIAVTGNAGTATKLATARTINGVAFDGTANITIADSTKIGAANYATSTTGGTVKVRLNGSVAYFTTNGANA
jgi:hypothetical protein